ncbi:hypothetical protein SMAC4_12992 [Sordaria macrospora]|uniref:uncharacterized protein n=1 Tax=Sordaria macrospora TaxID=5147 RepID=UPI002B30AC6F|nr:hypothetical protein SMAC4_12992 [Sordaria macrospora]
MALSSHAVAFTVKSQPLLLRAALEIRYLPKELTMLNPMGLYCSSTPSLRRHHYGPTRSSFGIPGTREDCPEPQQPRRHQNGGGGG